MPRLKRKSYPVDMKVSTFLITLKVSSNRSSELQYITTADIGLRCHMSRERQKTIMMMNMKVKVKMKVMAIML